MDSTGGNRSQIHLARRAGAACGALPRSFGQRAGEGVSSDSELVASCQELVTSCQLSVKEADAVSLLADVLLSRLLTTDNWQLTTGNCQLPPRFTMGESASAKKKSPSLPAPHGPELRMAAIDVGSNSLHMVIAQADPDGAVTTLWRMKEMVGLGRMSFPSHRLSKEAMDRATTALGRVQP